MLQTTVVTDPLKSGVQKLYRNAIASSCEDHCAYLAQQSIRRYKFSTIHYFACYEFNDGNDDDLTVMPKDASSCSAGTRSHIIRSLSLSLSLSLSFFLFLHTHSLILKITGSPFAYSQRN